MTRNSDFKIKNMTNLLEKDFPKVTAKNCEIIIQKAKRKKDSFGENI